MNEIYELIEKKIKASGYTIPFTGEDIYSEICDLIEEKDNGTYILMSKHSDNILFEYNVTIMDNDFNLSTLSITTPDNSYYINFDD